MSLKKRDEEMRKEAEKRYHELQMEDQEDDKMDDFAQDVRDQDSDNNNEDFYRGYPYQLVDQIPIEIKMIQIKCIATHIMEITRSLSRDEKVLLARYCDRIILNSIALEGESTLKKLQDYKNTNQDMVSVKTVTNLNFDDDDEKWLKQLYKNTNQEGGFQVFYTSMIKNAL